MRLTIAILGLGEAGCMFATELLKNGVVVKGFDPVPNNLPNGIHFANSNSAAVDSADIVFSVNWSSVSESIAQEVSGAIKPGTIYAEMNTSSPAQKRKVAEILKRTGALFVDAAIMAPVAPKRLKTPILATGPGAEQFQKHLSPNGMDISILEGEIGDAAGRKLLRSIIYKGIAAVVCEAMEAAEVFGLQAYEREQLMTMLKGDESVIDRLVNGSRKHATRRMHEMEAVVEMLVGAKVDAITSQAAVDSLKRWVSIIE